ncbi:hypothetical protein O3G_MSEX007063 [Manduca sexta]|uniref:Uncharacterized protein n=1 Tax=Manduca sexta TaxID=7130 RepID=A0A921Z677_MANSE|nr:hypothetical protein O3G_MSEX007063 [Manduca sexta]
MLPSRYIPPQTSSMRKSRLEGKPSMLPKPRRPGSTDRLSTEARRPSAAGHRSSSAEPPRGTFSRLSREASSTNLPINGRTPSQDRSNRTWQTSLERALAFVTVKDQRPISNVAWQRSECARVQEALASRAGGAGAGGMALIRPLTIARFVDITGALLTSLIKDAKLNTDNYVAKLPHLSKRLLYPGTVSKSWLKTVNTLHAFPQALALISYLLDLINLVELPVLDEWLYLDKDELARLRRDYIYKCWIRFQDPEYQFEDLDEEYLHNLKILLGNDEQKILDLQKIIQKYEACLEDEVEAAARAHEARLVQRRDDLLQALRSQKAARTRDRAQYDALQAQAKQHQNEMHQIDVDIERASAECQQLKREVETQEMSMSERTRLLDEVDYSSRVRDSKRALAEQIAKMVLSKETELAQWQKKALDTCVEYKQGLIHLSAQFPDLASLAIDENELMESHCASRVCGAVDALRARAAALGSARAGHARTRAALHRRRTALLEETRTKICELKTSVNREQQSLDSELAKESSEALSWSTELQQLTSRLDELRVQQDEYVKVQRELDFWEKQNTEWLEKLTQLQKYIESKQEEAQRLLRTAREKRVALVRDKLREWNALLQN